VSECIVCNHIIIDAQHLFHRYRYPRIATCTKLLKLVFSTVVFDRQLCAFPVLIVIWHHPSARWTTRERYENAAKASDAVCLQLLRGRRLFRYRCCELGKPPHIYIPRSRVFGRSCPALGLIQILNIATQTMLLTTAFLVAAALAAPDPNPDAPGVLPIRLSAKRQPQHASLHRRAESGSSK